LPDTFFSPLLTGEYSSRLYFCQEQNITKFVRTIICKIQTEERKNMFTFYQKTVIINKNYYTKSPGKDVRIGLYYKNRDRFEKEKRRK